MKKFKLLIICALVLAVFLAGCKSMQLDYMETDTVDGPAMVRQGQNIDPRLITVWGVYKDGSRKTVQVSSSDITFNKSMPGPQQVKVRVSRQEVSFMTEVMALRSIEIASPPRVTLFKFGDEPDPTWPGLEIRGEWDQMGSDKINISSTQITGFMKNQDGKQTIRVSYEGLVTTFDIDIRSMTSIQITQVPTKYDYFQGQDLDLTGLRVVGIWDGFPSENIVITRQNVTGFNPNNAGVQRLTITYNDKIADFSVEVLALTSIEVDKPPTKTVYKFGEPLNLTGIMVKGNYTGADPSKRVTEIIPEEMLTAEGYDPNRIGRQQRVTVMVIGQAPIANFFVDVELPDPVVAPQPQPQ